eukprot:gene10588-14225_t
MSSFENEIPHWQQFHGTELGALMNQLYSNQHKPKINYPKFKKSSTNSLPVNGKFIGVGANPHAVDPRKSTRKQINISVPQFNSHSRYNSQDEDENTISSSNKYPLIDMIPKRKSNNLIKNEMEEIKLRQQYYRPANTHAVSTEHEKERLNQIFTHKGGKGLPEGFIHPIGETPFERADKKKEQERIQQIKFKRSGSNSLMKISTPPTVSDQLMEQISDEINERREYLLEMENLGGLKKQDEIKLRSEISQKVEELKRLMR